MGEYADKLTTGHKALLEQYGDTFKMNVYPTRRSASYPDYVYEATKANALTAELVDGGNGGQGCNQIRTVPDTAERVGSGLEPHPSLSRRKSAQDAGSGTGYA